jgi:hypothetical protein
MKRPSETERLQKEHTFAEEKARMWAARGVAAREQGRDADSRRCEAKARDWRSKARQIERQQAARTSPGRGRSMGA